MLVKEVTDSTFECAVVTAYPTDDGDVSYCKTLAKINLRVSVMCARTSITLCIFARDF